MDAAHGDPPRAGGAILDDGPRRRWQKTGAAIGVSVNISARNLTAENLPELVCAAIDRAGIPAACLELESTGSALMGDLERAQQRLGELRALGLRLAIDDFGTGMSSLSYLRDLPVQGLKTDRGFIADMHGTGTGMAPPPAPRSCEPPWTSEGSLGLETVRAWRTSREYVISRPLLAADILAWCRCLAPKLPGARHPASPGG